MNKKLTIFAFAAVAVLAACGGGGSGGGGPTPQSGPTVPPAVPSLTIGVSLPTTSIGSVNDPTFGQVAGYTQSIYSQSLAFPVGSVVTVQNLSSSTTHTFDVVGTTSFPANPTLPMTANGGGVLSSSYDSGNITGGSSVSITMSNAGTFYFGCAYHYLDSPQMRDVVQVSNSATPGPEATPPPSATTGCTGYYC